MEGRLFKQYALFRLLRKSRCTSFAICSGERAKRI